MENQVEQLSNIKTDSSLVFYVSASEAFCLDCAYIANLFGHFTYEDMTPVYSDGTGDDKCGLICACGISYDMETQTYNE